VVERELQVLFAELVRADGIPRVLVGPTGVILNLNGQAETLLGYAHDELVDRHVHTLIPERFRDYHAALRNVYNSDPRPRQLESRELVVRRCDGSDLQVEIGLLPATTSAGVYTLVTLRDRT
jgi:PAS domain S-box-containing protein